MEQSSKLGGRSRKLDSRLSRRDVASLRLLFGATELAYGERETLQATSLRSAIFFQCRALWHANRTYCNRDPHVVLQNSLREGLGSTLLPLEASKMLPNELTGWDAIRFRFSHPVRGNGHRMNWGGRNARTLSG